MTLKSSQERFALIGHPVKHSLSPYIHQKIFEILDLDAEYKVIDIAPEDLEANIPALLQEYKGINVTIPHKERVIPYLDALSSAAERYGAVNTIFNNKGYNTDSAGFMSNNFQYRDKKVLIIGTGGVAKTMLHSVARDGARQIGLLSRSIDRAQEIIQSLHIQYPNIILQAFNHETLNTYEGSFHFILNGTPLGMWPKLGNLPLEEETYIRLLQSEEMEAVFDSIYNPLATRFILLARNYEVKAMAGLKMLFFQAFESERIWQEKLFRRFSEEYVLQELAKVQKALARQMLDDFPMKIVLTGFMASGKTTTAQALANALGNDFRYVDLDHEIERREGMEISRIFSEKGESYFREIERTYLNDILQSEESMVLAVGGGTLVQDSVSDIIHANACQIIFLDASLETSLLRAGSRESRPLLQQSDEEIRELYETRSNLYRKMADYTIDADQEIDLRVQTILAAFDLH